MNIDWFTLLSITLNLQHQEYHQTHQIRKWVTGKEDRSIFQITEKVHPPFIDRHDHFNYSTFKPLAMPFEMALLLFVE